MKYLFLDSSHRYLIVALLEDQKVIASSIEACWKQQSERIFPTMIQLMNENKWDVDDIEGVIVTQGPGSYTGIRIALTISKVLCTTKKLPLYTLSTLALYAGVNQNTLVMLDARSKRAYCAHYDMGKTIMEPCILTIDEVKQYIKDHDCNCIGDTNIIDIESNEVDFKKNIEELFETKELVENIHVFTPCYLKGIEGYKG